MMFDAADLTSTGYVDFNEFLVMQQERSIFV